MLLRIKPLKVLQLLFKEAYKVPPTAKPPVVGPGGALGHWVTIKGGRRVFIPFKPLAQPPAGSLPPDVEEAWWRPKALEYAESEREKRILEMGWGDGYSDEDVGALCNLVKRLKEAGIPVGWAKTRGRLVVRLGRSWEHALDKWRELAIHAKVIRKLVIERLRSIEEGGEKDRELDRVFRQLDRIFDRYFATIGIITCGGDIVCALAGRGDFEGLQRFVARGEANLRRVIKSSPKLQEIIEEAVRSGDYQKRLVELPYTHPYTIEAVERCDIWHGPSRARGAQTSG
jgi:hypothetical protein